MGTPCYLPRATSLNGAWETPWLLVGFPEDRKTSKVVLPPVFGCQVFLSETDSLSRFPQAEHLWGGASSKGLGEETEGALQPFLLAGQRGPPCLQGNLPPAAQRDHQELLQAVSSLCSLQHQEPMPAPPSLAGHSALRTESCKSACAKPPPAAVN